ncbi:MAG: PAS domain S-box protein, partial [Acidobacteriota bacterium]|nr:PAS domain S-box protein [Acidobacteriota bacterium]
MSLPRDDVTVGDQANWRHVLDTLAHAVAVVDDRRIVRFVNEHLVSLTGVERRHLVGRAVTHLFRTRGDDASPFDEALEQATRSEPVAVRALLRRVQAEPCAVRVMATHATFRDPAWTLLEIVDDHDWHDAQRHLAEQLQRFRLAFENNMAPMGIADRDDHLIEVNAAFSELVGFGVDELLGADTRLFTHPEDVGVSEDARARLLREPLERLRYVKRLRRKDGRI